MARYEHARGSPRETDRPFEVYDAEAPAPALASLMLRLNAERVTALLNGTVSGCGGGSLAPLTDDELANLAANVAAELSARAREPEATELERDLARGAGYGGDTVEALLDDFDSE